MAINLDQLIAQRAEATGVDGTRVAFTFKETEWTFRDPMMLSDEEKDELAGIEHDVDVAAWYMGDEQYDKFLDAGGNSSIFFLAFREHMKAASDLDGAGRPTRPNRSWRRAAAQKQRKRG